MKKTSLKFLIVRVGLQVEIIVRLGDFEFLDEDKIRIHLIFDRGNIYEGLSGVPT